MALTPGIETQATLVGGECSHHCATLANDQWPKWISGHLGGGGGEEGHSSSLKGSPSGLFPLVIITRGLIIDWYISKFQKKEEHGIHPSRASDISRGCGPAKFRHFLEIPRNSPKNAKYREIRKKYFQIHVGKTYLILILAIRPFLFTPNVQIYLETSSLQRVNNVLQLPGVLRWTLRKTGY